MGDTVILDRESVPLALGFCQGPAAVILPLTAPVTSGYRLEIALTFIAIFAFAVIAFGVWVAIQQKVEEPFAFDNITTEGQDIPPPIDGEPLEATIVEELTDDTSS